jgi:hypothetical protein
MQSRVRAQDRQTQITVRTSQAQSQEGQGQEVTSTYHSGIQARNTAVVPGLDGRCASAQRLRAGAEHGCECGDGDGVVTARRGGRRLPVCRVSWSRLDIPFYLPLGARKACVRLGYCVLSELDQFAALELFVTRGERACRQM